MKRLKSIYFIVMFLPLLITLIALQFLPGEIPAHYDINQQVTRWGSKYETLILPVLTLTFGFFMLKMAKISVKQEKDRKGNEKITLLSGLISLGLFNIMTFYFLYADFHKIENLSDIPVDIYQLFCGILGIAIIIWGNFMPKLQHNAVIGLRTKSSMKNETTWKKSQRFGKISFRITGFIVILISLFVKGCVALLTSLGILCLCALIDIIYARKIAEKF